MGYKNMENIRNEQMYKDICKKIGVDIIDDYLWRKQKEKEYYATHKIYEDDRSSEEINREIYGDEYVVPYKELENEEIDYVLNVCTLRYRKSLKK